MDPNYNLEDTLVSVLICITCSSSDNVSVRDEFHL